MPDGAVAEHAHAALTLFSAEGETLSSLLVAVQGAHAQPGAAPRHPTITD